MSTDDLFGHDKDALRAATEHERLIYLAGYLEGEGSFITCSPHGRTYPLVVCETTDEDVAERIAHLLGSKVDAKGVRKDRPTHKPVFRVRLAYSKARDLMESIYPYMGVRRQEAIRKALA